MYPPINTAAVERAARILSEGGLVAIPTETVYGLAADADNRDAVLKTFAVKGRPTNHPLIVHIAGVRRTRGSQAACQGLLARAPYDGSSQE